MKPTLLLAALAACDSSRAASSEPSPPAGDVDQPPFSDAFVGRVNGATSRRGEQIDARALGTFVEAYLLTRYGATDDLSGIQTVDLALVLVGVRDELRVELAQERSTREEILPFGTMTASPPLAGGAFHVARDAFPEAPAWISTAPVLLAQSVPRLVGPRAWIVTHEDGQLVAWSTGSDAWEAETTVQLADGAEVVTPTPVIEPPPREGALVTRWIERREREDHGAFEVLASLRIGDHVAPVTSTLVSGRGGAWVLLPEPGDLPRTVPRMEPLLAYRAYELEDFAQRLVFGRVGDDLVGWEQIEIAGDRSPWEATVRIPFSPETILEIR